MCSDLFAVNEEDFKEMGMKFGHRKRLVEMLRLLDCLSTFLSEIGLEDHKAQLKQLGFESIWSILGVEPEYAETMHLTQEEMSRWMEHKKTLVGERRR